VAEHEQYTPKAIFGDVAMLTEKVPPAHVPKIFYDDYQQAVDFLLAYKNKVMSKLSPSKPHFPFVL
jgi:hypothetical protein